MSLIFSREVTLSQKLFGLVLSAGVQAMLLFRISHWLSKWRVARGLRLHSLIYRLNQLLCHVDIAPEARIGQRLCLPHPMGVVIGETAEIGDDVTILQNATIGSRNFGQTGKRHATVGNRVYIGPGAIILGPVSLGDRATIAAGSIVLSDVLADTIVMGVHKRTADCDNS